MLRIMICVIRSPTVYRLARFLAYMFPSASYHLVSVINPVKTRALLTTGYRRLLEATIEEALDEVTRILARQGIAVSGKTILYGSTHRELLGYAVEKKIDLVAVTPRARPPYRSIGHTARRIIEHSPAPVLLYTSLHDPIPSETVEVIVEKRVGDRAKHILDELTASHYRVKTRFVDRYTSGEGAHLAIVNRKGIDKNYGELLGSDTPLVLA